MHRSCVNGVMLGLLLERVGGRPDREGVSIVCDGRRSAALLQDVRELVAEELLVAGAAVFSGGKHDVPPDCKRPCPDRSGGFRGVMVCMNPYVSQVLPEMLPGPVTVSIAQALRGAE